jgi:hypothetical protein
VMVAPLMGRAETVHTATALANRISPVSTTLHLPMPPPRGDGQPLNRWFALEVRPAT